MQNIFPWHSEGRIICQGMMNGGWIQETAPRPFRDTSPTPVPDCKIQNHGTVVKRHTRSACLAGFRRAVSLSSGDTYHVIWVGESRKGREVGMPIGRRDDFRTMPRLEPGSVKAGRSIVSPHVEVDCHCRGARGGHEDSTPGFRSKLTLLTQAGRWCTVKSFYSTQPCGQAVRLVRFGNWPCKVTNGYCETV